MFGVLSSLISMRTQSKQYKAQAEVARTNARTARATANSQAENTRAAARRNQEIQGQNIRRAEENATAQVASVRNNQAGSGFTTEGSGKQAAVNAQSMLDVQIANMAQSASVAMSNAWQTSYDTIRQGEMRAVAYEGQAAAYAAASKSVRSGMLLTAAGGIIGMGLSAYGTYTSNENLRSETFKKATDKNGKILTDDKGQALYANGKAYAQNLEYYNQHTESYGLNLAQGFEAGGSIGSTFNPYTAALYGGDANNRKNNWGYLFAVTNGNIPYNPELKSNPLGTLY